MFVLAANVNTRPVVLHEAAAAAQVATALYVALLKVPAVPVALVHVAAFHVTSDAFHVAAPLGGVKAAAFAWSDILSCLRAVESTTPVAETDVAVAAVDVATLPTLNVTALGTVTLACSDTVAVTVVVWLVLGRATLTCAHKALGAARNNPPMANARTSCALINLLPSDATSWPCHRLPRASGFQMLSTFHVITSV
jgi:hypothetical protein